MRWRCLLLNLLRCGRFFDDLASGFFFAFSLRGISFMFEGQAAHQPSAQPGYFFRVERHALLLGHFDGHPFQILQNPRAADRAAANSQTFDNPRLLARADLLELDSRFEF